MWWLRQGMVAPVKGVALQVRVQSGVARMIGWLGSRRLGEGVRNAEMASRRVREKGMGLSKGIWKGDLVLSEGEKDREGRRVKLTKEE
ncbi:unnamed protein product [Sphenostylis stenocarpa]|uniref:Uncharacterized protein n=1 Tax=Sphenostylis stenocarpa TaxID=92480 RepID=A0AA86VQY7_9FABA|nr:unnamed protein product [Sphenostylis stenocarpa]